MASIFDLFVAIQGDNSGYKKAMRESQDATTAFEKTAVSAASRLGDAFAALGLKLSAVGIGAFILNAGENFEKAQAKISRATGETGKSLESLSASFANLYARSGRSAEEVADALAKVRVETKLQGAELEALTSANLKFAKVTGSDVAQSIDQTQVLFQNWGIATADQSEALDVLYFTMTKAGMGASDLSSQMTALGPLARAFGLTFTQTAALVGTFDDAGLKASDMVRGLNKLFAEAVKAGKDPIATFAELVNKLRDVKTYAEAAQKLMAYGIPSKSIAEIADAAKRGAFNFKEFAKEAEGAKGKVDDVAKSTKTFGDHWRELQHQLEIAAAPAGNFIVKWAADSIEKLNTMASVLSFVVKAAIRSSASLPFSPFPASWKDFGLPEGAPVVVPAGSGGLNKPGPGGGAPPPPPIDIGDAFKALGLKDLNKELAESIRAFQALAASGKATHDQMLQAAEAIRHLRAQLPAKKQGVVTDMQLWLADLGINWNSNPTREQDKVTLDQLRNLPLGIHGGVTQDDVAALASYNRNLQLLNDTLGASVTAASLAQRNVDAVTDAFHDLGLNTPAELEKIAKDAKDDYDLISESGTASADAIGQAWARMFKAQLDAQLATGKITRAEYDDLVKQVDAAFGKMGQSGQRMARTLGQEFEQMTHRMFDNLERGIARSIVQWKGWGETFKSIAQTVAEDTLEILLKGLFAPLEKKIAGILGSIGGGASSASSAASGAAGIGSGAGGAASSVGGVAGAVNMVSGVVSAVSSVVGNFQMAGMNKSLDVLVNHTLRIFNELTNFRADAWTREQHWYVRTGEMWQAMLDIKDILGRGISTSGGGKGGLTINMNNVTINGSSPQAVAQAIFDQAALAGAL